MNKQNLLTMSKIRKKYKYMSIILNQMKVHKIYHIANLLK